MARVVSYDVPKTQTIKYHVKPLPGHIMSAKSVAQQIEALCDCLVAGCNKESGIRWNALLLNIETKEDGSMEFELMLAPKKSGNKKSDLFEGVA